MQARFIRNLLVFCICISFAETTNAQEAARIYVQQDGWAIGTDIGTTDLWGDIGTKSVIQHYTNSKYTNKMCFMGGLFGRYSIHPALTVRVMANYGVLYATDAWNYDQSHSGSTLITENNDALQRFLREQNAKDEVFEASSLIEVAPFRINPESRSASRRGQLYLAAGIGIMHFTPYSTVANSTDYVDVYNLDLEGQGWGAGYPKQYSLWQPVIPLAIGYRWDIGKHLNLGFEFMYRYTFCKNLDGATGNYVDPTAFYAHMSPTQAALAESVADKEQYFNDQYANQAGNLVGTPVNDSYSSFTITFAYKIFAAERKWWR